MTKRWLDVLYSSRPELRPARALLSPIWLGALAVLAVNDHLLKGAALVPAGLTGKLSDIAGMLVAPTLLAAILGLKSRRGLLHCHIAVGLVFAAINLSPAAADAWSWLMGLVGFPWAITVDPTDLLALPALALGWRALVPAMQPVSSVSLSRSPAPRWRAPEYGAAAVGALLCVATSPSQPDDDWDPDNVIYQDIFADVYVHNSHPDLELTVRVRELREDVQVDCFQAESDPGVLFSEPLFGAGQTWSIPPGANIPARVDGESTPRDCYAVLLTSDTIAPTILFWHASDVRADWVRGQHAGPDEYGPGVVVLTADDDGVAAIDSADNDYVFAQRPPAENAYIPGSDAVRVDWSDPPSGLHQITELELGSDGCAAFTFDGGQSSRFYLCTPLTELPFAATDYVSIEDHGDLIVIARAPDPGDPTPIPDVQLAASRGTILPAITGGTLAVKPIFDGDLGPDPRCGTIAQPQEFSAQFGGQNASFTAGESVTLDDGSHALTLHGVHAERRFILSGECAEGPDQLGDDLEIVYVWTDSPQP